jgi:hypothetical protein
MDIITLLEEKFSYDESADLAFLVYRRFGRDVGAASSAWSRLMQNATSPTSFRRLIRHSRLNDEK